MHGKMTPETAGMRETAEVRPHLSSNTAMLGPWAEDEC